MNNKELEVKDTNAFIRDAWPVRIRAFYQRHETWLNGSFFIGGFLFDVFTLSGVDDPFWVGQQVVYLGLIGWIFYKGFLFDSKQWTPLGRLAKIWEYHVLILHFMLGSLISVYSLFFLKSASLSSSLVFICLMLVVLVANELPWIHAAGWGPKMCLYFLCLFSFFSILWPTLLGYVGRIPFALSLFSAGVVLLGMARWVYRRVPDRLMVSKRIVLPVAVSMILTFSFYLVGWIPPVPLAAVHMGIYHRVEKRDGAYWLYHERPAWAFWREGDQDFVARPGDSVYFFTQIYSPARFSDEVTLHWFVHKPKEGWVSTDRIPMHIIGGRRTGYRGYSYKSNYFPGDWRVKIETTDGREIGRLHFRLWTSTQPADPERFKVDIHS